MNMRIPDDALYILNRLCGAGFSAYVVGGCVRDGLLGKEPKDWDICTSARPEQLQAVFCGDHVVETGLKHGTLTVVRHHVPYEVTTYRVDGEYTDHRHPDGVTFVEDVRDDLARRDFTVNAMAYHPETGLVDAFGGQEDLAARVIRCVGDADRRFEEDALRILRALRFASVYDFTIEAETSAAVHRLFPPLADVAAERIRVELAKLLCGRGVGRILREYADVITFILPELAPCVGFDQKNHHHRFDVWEHTVRAVENVPATETLRLTALLHDCGKPLVFTVDASGEGHMHGHQKASRDLAEAALTRLKLDNATRDRVLTLVERHDIPLTDEHHLLTRRLSQLGEEPLRQLIDFRCADRIATGTVSAEESTAVRDATLADLDAILASNPCVTLKDLAVNGGDLASAGFPKGKLMGECLRMLLDRVIAGDVENERDALLSAADTWLAAQ